MTRLQTSAHPHGVSPFWKHFFEMLGAMMLGMMATAAVFLTAVGLKTWDEVTTEYPTQSLLAMAVGMTLPMAAWMAYRGMSRRSTVEMSAVMVLLALPCLLLVWLGITDGAQCGVYCLLMVVGMYAVMKHRQEEYSHS